MIDLHCNLHTRFAQYIISSPQSISTWIDMKQNCKVGGVCLWVLFFASSIRTFPFLSPGNILFHPLDLLTCVLFSFILPQLFVNWLLLNVGAPIYWSSPSTNQPRAPNHLALHISVQPLPSPLQMTWKLLVGCSYSDAVLSSCHHIISSLCFHRTLYMAFPLWFISLCSYSCLYLSLSCNITKLWRARTVFC